MLYFLYFSKAAFQQNVSKKKWEYLPFKVISYHHLLELSNFSTRLIHLFMTALLMLVSLSISKKTHFSAFSTSLNFLNLSLLHHDILCTAEYESQPFQNT